MHLDLKLRILLHVRVLHIEDLRGVDDLHGALESLDVVGGRVFEILCQLLIEGKELRHFESEIVLASLDIILQLLPINEDVILLRLPDEVHKLVLGVMQGVLVLVPLQVIVD